MKTYYVYIMTSETGTFYTGITSNLKRRIFEHKSKAIPGFTSRYNATKLIYVETFKTPDAAIRREKQIKAWRREKKIELIDSKNPAWHDLAADWYADYKESPSAAEK
jgi:putative endonuclease